jgi:hypothetical protein
VCAWVRRKREKKKERGKLTFPCESERDRIVQPRLKKRRS